MAKFSPGDRVRIAFNAQKLDERVPDQRPSKEHPNGLWGGTGNYQTEAHTGVVEEIVQKLDANGDLVTDYVVGSIDFQDGYDGAGNRVPKISNRRRRVPESKLSLVD